MLVTFTFGPISFIFVVVTVYTEVVGVRKEVLVFTTVGVYVTVVELVVTMSVCVRHGIVDHAGRRGRNDLLDEGRRGVRRHKVDGGGEAHRAR